MYSADIVARRTKCKTVEQKKKQLNKYIHEYTFKKVILHNAIETLYDTIT